jgi:hypothetical protein
MSVFGHPIQRREELVLADGCLARTAKQPFADLPNIIFHRLLSANIGNRGSRPWSAIQGIRITTNQLQRAGKSN